MAVPENAARSSILSKRNFRILCSHHQGRDELTPFEVLLDGHILLLILNIKFKTPGVLVVRPLDCLLAVKMCCPHSDAFNKCGSPGTKTGIEEFLHGFGEIPWLIKGSRANYVKLSQDRGD